MQNYFLLFRQRNNLGCTKVGFLGQLFKIIWVQLNGKSSGLLSVSLGSKAIRSTWRQQQHRRAFQDTSHGHSRWQYSARSGRASTWNFCANLYMCILNLLQAILNYICRPWPWGGGLQPPRHLLEKWPSKLQAVWATTGVHWGQLPSTGDGEPDQRRGTAGPVAH